MRAPVSKILITSLATLLISACVEPFNPPYSDTEVNFLVVDGSINTSNNSAKVTLTRALALSSTEAFAPEGNAVVSIEEEGGNSIILPEQNSGVYTLTSLSLDLAKKYKLHIETADSKTYESTFIQLKQSPAIDSISWKAASDGLTLYSNTHDPSNATRYYRWDYVETYMYRSAFDSNFKFEDGEAIYRTPEERIHTCWRTMSSTKILIGSSAKLSQDAITNNPLTFIPKGSEKLGIRYSILVRQRAISQDEYNFLDQLQKTTESLGGLFDPLPSQVVGNVTSLSDPSEAILGNFSGGSVMEERIFINPGDLPAYLRIYIPPMGGCTTSDILLEDLPSFSTQNLLVDPILLGGITLIGYTYTSTPCADCRLKGGTNIKPAFWE